jgi:hypothetical protein
VASRQLVPHGDWAGAFSSVEIFAINDRRNAMASTENYGILGDAIPVAA